MQLIKLIKQKLCRHTFGPFTLERKASPVIEIEEIPALNVSRHVKIQYDHGHTVCTKCGKKIPTYIKNYQPLPGDPFENSEPTQAERDFSASIPPVSPNKATGAKD